MEELVKAYQGKGILLDTNLLLPYLVGALDPRHLKACGGSTRYFGPEDFPLLVRFVALFGNRLVTTPHILTEVSNLLGRLDGPVLAKIRLLFREMIARMHEHDERSIIVSASDDFLQLGLTDTAISMVSPKQYLVLTDDAGLARLLGTRGIDVVNFNEVRAAAGMWGRQGVKRRGAIKAR